MGFSLFDYIVLCLYFLILVCIGSWFSKKQRDIKDYFLGGRSIPWIIISISIVATETSALTFIGVPAISFISDFSFIQLAFGYLIARIILSLTLIKRYYYGEYYTPYSFLNFRFGREVKNFVGILFFITRILASGVRLYAISLVLSVITGISIYWSIVIIGITAVLYTYLGGITAVIWTDVIQMGMLILGGLFSLFVLADKIPGGLCHIIKTGFSTGKFKFLDFSLDFSIPYSFFAGVIGGTIFGMASHGTDQSLVQRILTAKNYRGSRNALVLSGILIIPQFLLFLFIGVMLFIFYQNNRLDIPLSEADRIFPSFIVNEIGRGLSGLIIAGVFSAAMSSLDSALNALASTTIADFYIPYSSGKKTDKEILKISRLLTLFWGGILIGFAFISILFRNWGSVLEIGLSVASFTYGSMLGIFLLGMSSCKFNSRVIIFSACSGILFVIFIRVFTGIAWPWFAVIGCLTTVFISFLFNLVSNYGRGKSSV
ncbi:sodium:solute symporter [candidate division KSB1 bacterium]|nr:MAG: sodium:solute symporter [candidate division KSB1 bacterium]